MERCICGKQMVNDAVIEIGKLDLWIGSVKNPKKIVVTLHFDNGVCCIGCVRKTIGDAFIKEICKCVEEGDIEQKTAEKLVIL